MSCSLGLGYEDGRQPMRGISFPMTLGMAFLLGVVVSMLGCSEQREVAPGKAAPSQEDVVSPGGSATSRTGAASHGRDVSSQAGSVATGASRPSEDQPSIDTTHRTDGSLGVPCERIR